MERGRINLLERAGKQGLGCLYMSFRWALGVSYDFVLEMDADFSHNPKDLPRLYNACAQEGADVAIGSRYVKSRCGQLAIRTRTDELLCFNMSVWLLVCK